MKIAVIRYNAGNIQSVLNALNRLGYEALLTDKEAEIKAADKVIFPGVGEASSAMQYLREKGIDGIIRQLEQPVLGICLGMQLLGGYSEENNTVCLGIIPVKIKKLPSVTADGQRVKVPHIGWNTIETIGHPLFKNLPEKPFFYFVHSYAMELNDCTLARTEYSTEFTSAVSYRNFYGVQFHPEKSAAVGEQLLKNFLNL